MKLAETITSELTEYLRDLTAKNNRLQLEEERIATEREANQRLIEGVRAVLETYPEWRDSKPVGEGTPEPTIDAQDLMDCRTQKDTLKEIGNRSGGVVRTSTAAKLLIDAGKTISNLGDATASVHRLMSEDPDWDYHEPGTFRYLPFFGGLC